MGKHESRIAAFTVGSIRSVAVAVTRRRLICSAVAVGVAAALIAVGLRSGTESRPLSVTAPRPTATTASAEPSSSSEILTVTLRPSPTPAKRRTPKASAPPVATLTGLALPLLVFQAYHHAADLEAIADPSCHLPWWLLAGIGHTESGNAEGGRLFADGTTRGRILGPRLDGHLPDNAIVRDTDHGVLDGDTLFDRAVGPMQFLPSTWRIWQADGNHDGRRDPNNIFDSTLAAAGYLCASGRDLRVSSALDAAVLSYNHSDAYLATVLAWGHAYRDGAATVTDSGLPVVTDVTAVRPPLSSRPPARSTPAGSTPSQAPRRPSQTPGPIGSSSTAQACPIDSSSPQTSTPAGSPTASPSDTTSASASTSPTPTPSGTSPSGPSGPTTNSTSPTASPTCRH